METLSNAAQYTLRFINQTHKSIFLTGKAGTGKTTLLKEIIRTTHKNVVVVAPTGIAALNAGGVTIHSMFQLPFAGFIPEFNQPPQFSDTVKFETKDSLRRHFRMRGDKQAVITSMELLVIDEVSMLRADLLDAIDYMLRTIRRKDQPFGGIQVLFIGDLLQLPPVVRNEEWNVLRNYYKGKFFFHSRVVQQNPPLYIELSKIYRQTDSDFIAILNNLRNNRVSAEDVNVLNEYVKPGFDFKENPGYITLTTHNAKADAMNLRALDDIDNYEYSFHAEIVDDFPEKIFPVEQELRLKKGAQVMFIKNDLSPEKNYFNGKIGIIKSLSDEEIYVHFPDENVTIMAEKYEWKNVRYYVDNLTKEIREEVLGTFVHYPLKLAWAITVHKSQGLTFDKAALDVSGVFMPGQAYVALSRLRSISGLVLLSPLRMNGISNDLDVMDYATGKAEEETLEASLKAETQRFIATYLKAGFDWKELAYEWHKHRMSYLEEGEKSLKAKHRVWAHQQSDGIHSLLDAAGKFTLQIDRLFTAEAIDMDFVNERVIAAYNYFLPTMDRVAASLLGKIEEIKKLKKAKSYFEELSELEELQTNAVLRLMRVRVLMEIVVSGREISKDNLTSPEIKTYKADTIASIRAEMRKNPETLSVEEEGEEYIIERYAIKKKEPKTVKKATTQETYELWQQKLSVQEIAAERKLTQTTIYSHFVKLIQAGQVALKDLLPAERIAELANAFEGYTEETLNPLKEKYGEQFSWDELKLYKAANG